MDEYYVRNRYTNGLSWEVWKRSRGGDRRLFTGASERTARRVARLLNEDDARIANTSLVEADL